MKVKTSVLHDSPTTRKEFQRTLCYYCMNPLFDTKTCKDNDRNLGDLKKEFFPKFNQTKHQKVLLFSTIILLILQRAVPMHALIWILFLSKQWCHKSMSNAIPHLQTKPPFFTPFVYWLLCSDWDRGFLLFHSAFLLDGRMPLAICQWGDRNDKLRDDEDCNCI